MEKSPKQTWTVLLADDSAQDRLLMRLALRSHPALAVVGEVEDGIELINYLSGEGKFKDRKAHPFPDVLILDLKMPLKTGYEILQWLQSQSFDDLCVIVVTGSSLPDDRDQSLALGADAFYVKAADRHEREAMVGSMEILVKKMRRHHLPRV